MTSVPTPLPAAPPGRRLAYRVAIPLAALALLTLFALSVASGLQTPADAALRLVGVEPGPFPFLDTHAVLAAAQCQRLGIDVYLANPCDFYGRPHVYSPLWLTLLRPTGMGVAATPWVGAGLDLLFIVSLTALIRPATRRELAVYAIAVFSPATLYLLERANNELVIFVLVLSAGLLQARGARCWRLCAYAIVVGAALLKYFPAVLLSLAAARERRRDALLIAGGAAIAAALFAAGYRDVLGQALANIPPLSYYTDSFSARNLPFGLATGLPMLADPLPFAVALFVIMAGLALVWLRRAVALLNGAAGLDWSTAEVRFAAIGGLLLAGCFFTGQNVDYRAVYLLFALPGLLQLRAQAPPAARWLLTRLIAAALFLMWEECFRRALLWALAERPGDRIAMVFWVAREWLWWWLIAGLAAVAICHLAQSAPLLLREVPRRLTRLRAATARPAAPPPP
jgi:hypothetical protein